METGDAAFARDALGIVARAYGMNKIATEAGVNRESLYKALGRAGNPGFSTVMDILSALGFTLAVRPAAAKRSRARKRRLTAKSTARIRDQRHPRIHAS
jgi:probable addiction module antidote protein